jgi:glutamate--cysteine ligase
MAMSLQALWKALMYDREARDEALRIAPCLTIDKMHELQGLVARDALSARFENINILNLAKEIIELAAHALMRIAPDEVAYLDVLRERVLVEELCPADILLRNWHGSWHHSMTRVIEYLRIA